MKTTSKGKEISLSKLNKKTPKKEEITKILNKLPWINKFNLK